VCGGGIMMMSMQPSEGLCESILGPPTAGGVFSTFVPKKQKKEEKE